MKRYLLFLFIFFLSGLARTVTAQPGTSSFDSTWTQYFRRNSGGWTAGDATISVPLPDGRAIWLFGDSYTVPVNTANNTLPCLFQVRNCYMVQDSVDRSLFKTILDTTMTGVNMTTFKLRPNDTSLFWPGHGYVAGDTVYIFHERYKSSTLAYEGCYIARLHLPDLHQSPLVRAPYTGTNAIFGRAVLADSAAGKLYIYGNRLNWIVWEPVVARTSLSNPFQPWEYYTGTGWSENPAVLQKICADPVSPGFSVFFRDGKYCLVTQENGYLECGLGRQIWSYTSTSPTGPFTGKTLLYTEESMFNGAYMLTYNAQAHPWATENDELLVCYNVNDRVDTVAPYVCPSQCKNIWTDRLDADSYRPKFVRVPMGLITSARGDISLSPGIIGARILGNPAERNGTFGAEVTTTKPWTGTVRLTRTDGRIVWEQPLTLPRGLSRPEFAGPEAGGFFLLEFRQDTGGMVVIKLVAK